MDAQGPGETVDFIPTIGSRFAIQGSALTALDSDPENMVLYVDTGAEAAPVRSALSDSIQDNDGSPLNCNFDNATGIIGCSAAGNAIQWWNCDGTLWIDPVGEAPAEAQNCQNIQLNVQSPNSTNSTEPPDNGGGNGGNGTTTPPDNGGDGSSATGFSIMIGCQSDSNCINSGQYGKHPCMNYLRRQAARMCLSRHSECRSIASQKTVHAVFFPCADTSCEQ